MTDLTPRYGRDLLDPLIAAHSGRTVKLMGDGALVEFASAVDAVTCAIEVQKQVREPMRAAQKTVGYSSGSASMSVTSSSMATTE